VSRPAIAGALVTLLALACGVAAVPPARAVCYAAADRRAQARVDAECKDGFAACPARDDILAQLAADQAGCP
jgi:hypothetical protein